MAILKQGVPKAGRVTVWLSHLLMGLSCAPGTQNHPQVWQSGAQPTLGGITTGWKKNNSKLYLDDSSILLSRSVIPCTQWQYLSCVSNPQSNIQIISLSDWNTPTKQWHCHITKHSTQTFFNFVVGAAMILDSDILGINRLNCNKSSQ